MPLPAVAATAHDDAVPSYREATDRVPHAEAARSSSPPSTLHSYSLRGLTLTYRSYAASPSSLPIFFTNSVVSGQLSWDIAKAEQPKSITVSIEGWLERASVATLVFASSSTRGENKEPVARKPFFRDTITLYPGSTGSSTLKPGQHTYDFSFRIPKHYRPIPAKTFGLDLHRHRTHFDLPPTFVERSMPYILQFAVVAEVKRGFMKLDNVLRAPFRHVPISIPDAPASPLHLDAYQLNLPLPPPDFDPDGYSCTAVALTGTLQGKKWELEAQVFLPVPHQYTTGSPVNFFLKLTTRLPSLELSSPSTSSTQSYSSQPSPYSSYSSSSHSYPPQSPSSPPSSSSSGPSSSSDHEPDVAEHLLDLLTTQPGALAISLARVLKVDGIPALNAVETVAMAKLWAPAGVDGTGASSSLGPPPPLLDGERSDQNEGLRQRRRQQRPPLRHPANNRVPRPSERSKWLQGEIPLRSHTRPDFVFPCLEVGYNLHLKINAHALTLPSGAARPPGSGVAPGTVLVSPPLSVTGSAAGRGSVNVNAAPVVQVPSGQLNSAFVITSTTPPLDKPWSPLLAVPIILTNASRLGEPKPRSYCPPSHSPLTSSNSNSTSSATTTATVTGCGHGSGGTGNGGGRARSSTNATRASESGTGPAPQYDSEVFSVELAEMRMSPGARLTGGAGDQRHWMDMQPRHTRQRGAAR